MVGLRLLHQLVGLFWLTLGLSMTELLRQGAPHLNTEDDVFGDYFIPKASVIVANVW